MWVHVHVYNYCGYMYIDVHVHCTCWSSFSFTPQFNPLIIILAVIFSCDDKGFDINQSYTIDMSLLVGIQR